MSDWSQPDTGDSLLVSLRSYRPRQDRDPLEDFVTEAFCWLLRQSEEFSKYFLKAVFERLGADADVTLPQEPVHWETQFSLDRSRVDMAASWPGSLMLFEHKVWSGLGLEQLENYRTLAAKIHPESQAHIILITANKAQHSAQADVCLCWSEIYKCIDEYLKRAVDDAHERDLRDFLALLTHEGLSPPAPIAHQAIHYWPIARKLPTELDAAFTRLQSRDWPVSAGYTCHFRKLRYGRVGLEFTRNDGSLEWAPGIFLGCILDGSDHGVDHRFDQVMLQLILDFDRSLHRRYPGMESYQALKDALAEKAAGSSWRFYDHLADKEARFNNAYHPLFLEKPLVDVLRGSRTADDQEQALGQSGSEVLSLLQGSSCLEALKEECDEVSG